MGVVVSSDASLSIGGAKLTAGRIGIILLLIPAISKLFQGSRRIVLSDVFAFATGVWMIGVSAYVDGANLSSTAAEALEFIGGYFVARGFFFGPSEVATFVRLLKGFTLVAILFALADLLAGRWVVPDILSPIFGVPALVPQYRSGVVRAISTFSHPILFGLFCSLVGAILLYAETDGLRRIMYGAVCVLGGLLSLSSVALLSYSIALSVYIYDRLLRRNRWRWAMLTVGLLVLLVAVVMSTNNPLGWLLSHLTLDPESSYFRLLIWDAALDRLSESPITGFSFGSLNDDILDATIDAAWLVYALRFGVPMIVLLFLTGVTAILPSGRRSAPILSRSYMDDMSTGFTIVVALFMFAGLTVHFWNYMWIFWGVCIGIRASLREWNLPSRRLERRGAGMTSVAMANLPDLA